MARVSFSIGRRIKKTTISDNPKVTRVIIAKLRKLIEKNETAMPAAPIVAKRSAKKTSLTSRFVEETPRPFFVSAP
jgi:hypothetical protein